jgi:DNA-binding beta-propeller fold protein YncE
VKRSTVVGAVCILLLLGFGGTSSVPGTPFDGKDVAVEQARVLDGAHPVNGRYEYVLLDGEFSVYPEGSTRPVQRVEVPTTKAGLRGVGVDVYRHVMYLSYGGDGGGHGTGSLLKYDLLTDKVVWQKDYPVGIDSFALTPDGNTIFMPGGEGDSAPWWYVIKTATGRAIARIDGGSYPHNTVVSLDGRRAYLGPRGDPWVTVVDAHTYRVIRKLGPLRESERPFTINRKQTLAFTTASLSRGFQVSSIRTGKVLYTVDFGAVPHDFHISTASHGISLSPNEKQVWVIDAVSNVVRAFDVSGLPGRRPRQIAALPVQRLEGDEEGCGYDCKRSGWVQHTLDGKYVYVGDTGDFFSTSPPKLAGFLPTLRNTRKHIEIDWRNGKPVSTSTRQGLGRRR